MTACTLSTYLPFQHLNLPSPGQAISKVDRFVRRYFKEIVVFAGNFATSLLAGRVSPIVQGAITSTAGIFFYHLAYSNKPVVEELIEKAQAGTLRSFPADLPGFAKRNDDIDSIVFRLSQAPSKEDDEPIGWTWLQGPPGTCKTTAKRQIIHELEKKGIPVFELKGNLSAPEAYKLIEAELRHEKPFPVVIADDCWSKISSWPELKGNPPFNLLVIDNDLPKDKAIASRCGQPFVWDHLSLDETIAILKESYPGEHTEKVIRFIFDRAKEASPTLRESRNPVSICHKGGEPWKALRISQEEWDSFSPANN